MVVKKKKNHGPPQNISAKKYAPPPPPEIASFQKKIWPSPNWTKKIFLTTPLRFVRFARVTDNCFEGFIFSPVFGTNILLQLI